MAAALSLTAIVGGANLLMSADASSVTASAATIEMSAEARYAKLQSEIGLAGVVDPTAFTQAMKGYGKIENHKKDLLVIIDFTKPSTEERLYIVDVKNRKLVLSSHVAHGRNSGGNYATSFSNESGSHKSSLGFYVTANTYMGRNGYSLVLDGLEKGFNDKARERAIVIHGAPYCDPSNIAAAGRLGRSFGCPALPPALNEKIIDTIKDGAVVFIYAADRDYAVRSPLLG